MIFDKYIAHRGITNNAPENTFLAFNKTYELGISWVEVDVQLSKDGIPVIFHDYDLNKLCGDKSIITDLSLDEIKKCSVLFNGYNHFNECIPTLDEYLTWMMSKPNIHTNLEIKVKPYVDNQYELRLVQVVLDVIKRFPTLRSRLLFSSFSLHVLDQLRKLSSSIYIGMLLEFKTNMGWDDFFKLCEKNYFKVYSKLNCIVLGINVEYLYQKHINQIRSYCPTILGYSNVKLTSNDADRLIGLGYTSIFIDSVVNNDE